MNKIILPEIWQGWSFQDQFLIDDAQNKYNIKDIRSLFYQRQLHSSLVGNKSDIVCLKNALEKKLKDAECEIVINLINDGESLKEVKFSI